MNQGGDGVGMLTVHGHAAWRRQPPLGSQSAPPESRPQIEHSANCLSRQAVDGQLRSISKARPMSAANWPQPFTLCCCVSVRTEIG